MGKLYPPVIEGTLPAFYSEKGIVKFTIPFSMNRAVSQAQVSGFEVKIKALQSGSVIYTATTFNSYDYSLEQGNCYVTFYIDDRANKLKIGQFYKVQLAYTYSAEKDYFYSQYSLGQISFEEYQAALEQRKETGYFTGTSIVKYTTKPTIDIIGLDKKFINPYTNRFVGSYKQKNKWYYIDENNEYIYCTDEVDFPNSEESTQYLYQFINPQPVGPSNEIYYYLKNGEYHEYTKDEYPAECNLYKRIITRKEKSDATEKIHTYRFDVYDDQNKIVWTSGDCLHNINLDTNLDYSEDIFYINADVQYEKMYYIQYSINTVNGLSLSTVKYKLVQREYIDPELNRTISAKNNFDEGYVDIFLNGELTEAGIYPFITGSFILLRAEEDSEYMEWQELKRFKFNHESPKTGYLLYRDYYLEQGKKYQYAVYQYNDNNLFSKKVYSEIIQADFEDAFLISPDKQLKLKYNVKMSKFANTRLEAKLDTIGSQFPFIFRNGNVDYHEFNIQGLISYFMDEAHSFMPEENLLSSEKTINYTTNNVAQERIFKMNVLEWLNDGEPKVFRSPTEGNFIIRMIKISLQPEQKLGRLLHNFSGTAYEIAEYNYNNLCKYGFITTGDYDRQILQWETIDLLDYKLGAPINSHNNLQTVQFTNLIPGTEILITFNDNRQETIVIGATGNYNMESDIGIQTMSIAEKWRLVIVSDQEEYRQHLYRVKDKKGNLQIVPTGIGPTSESNPLGLIPPFSYAEEYYQLVNKQQRGYVTYSYFTPQKNSYNTINNVTIDGCTMAQFIGSHDVLKEITHVKNQEAAYEKVYIPDVKTEIIKFYHLIARPRPTEYFEKKQDNDYIYLANVISPDKAHPFTLFYSSKRDEENEKDVIIFESDPTTDLTFDCNTDQFFLNNPYEYNPEIIINGETIVITHEIEINLEDFGEITELYTRNGVVIELIYQTRTIEYKVEVEEHEEIIIAKNKYETAKKQYADFLSQRDIDLDDKVRLRQELRIAHFNYIALVTRFLEEGG